MEVPCSPARWRTGRWVVTQEKLLDDVGEVVGSFAMTPHAPRLR
jgi:hypothetical protein